jgi:hypothetical protein
MGLCRCGSQCHSRPEAAKNLRFYAIVAVLSVFCPSCTKRDSSADIREVKRLVIDQGFVGVDSLSISVRLVHPEVAVVTSSRLVVKPDGDTLIVPSIMVFVLKDGKWGLRLDG